MFLSTWSGSDMFDQIYNDIDNCNKNENRIYPNTVIPSVILADTIPSTVHTLNVDSMSQVPQISASNNPSTSLPSSTQFGMYSANNNTGLSNSCFATGVGGYMHHDIPSNTTYNRSFPKTESVANYVPCNVGSNEESCQENNFVPALLQDSTREILSVDVQNKCSTLPFQKRVLYQEHTPDQYSPFQQPFFPIENQVINQESGQSNLNQEYLQSPCNSSHMNVLSQPTSKNNFSQENSNLNKNCNLTPLKQYKLVRGISAGGYSTRPPQHSTDSNSIFLLTELKIVGASVEDICYPVWSQAEKEDRRRIVRIERIQNGPRFVVNFSVVGSANESPFTIRPPPGVDVVEVSCLEHSVQCDNSDTQSSDDEFKSSARSRCTQFQNEKCFQYYITSVEVIEIVELLIGNRSEGQNERRRERGRIRSNLVPFWTRKPISSRMNDTRGDENNIDKHTHPVRDNKLELAKRIMGYEIRKPRGFDKEVRIMRWEKLVPALRRALQSYYTEMPICDAHLNLD